MNPVPWLQMTNMISYQGLVRTFPNSLRDVPYVWVPVGLIDERLEMECAGDFCTDDAMPWDETRSPSCHAGPVESLASLLKYLKLNS